MSTKTFDILPEMIMEYLMEDFCTNNEGFDQIYQIYRLKNSKCGRVKPRSDIP